MSDAKPQKKVPIPYAKESQEYRDEVRRRLRENWAKKKEQYRPKSEPEEEIQVGEKPPIPTKFTAKWTVPSDLHDILGESIALPDDWTKYPLYHVRRQSELSKSTIAQYKAYYYRMPRRDIWDVVRFIKTHPLAQQNMFAKAALSYICQDLWDSIYVNKKKGLASSSAYKTDLQTMAVFSELSKRTKRQSYEKHSSQQANEENIDNTVKWEDWEALARRFIRALTSKKDMTERDRKEVLVVAVYSLIPPVRLDWNDIEVRRTKGGKTFEKVEGEAGKNILWIAPRQAVVFWGEFKNSASFTLPLRQDLPRELVSIMQKVLPEGDSTPLKVSNFSTFLTHLAEQITGKEFSNRLMRSSYIRWWHNNNSKGEVNVEKTRELMTQMHQTNMQVHLSYVKHGKLLPNDIDADDAPKTNAGIEDSQVDGTNEGTA
jgi:hypothetical protein